MFGKLVLTLTILSGGILAQDKDANPSYKNPPSDTKAAKDHDVTLYCQVDNKGKNGLYWHCNNNNGNQDITVGPNENTNPALSKYTIDNSGAEIGQYNLVVTNVTELDSGRCTCIVDSSTGNAIESGADLEVVPNTARPNTPTCMIDKERTPGRAIGEFVADDYVLLTCESQGGVPLPQLHWEIFRTSNNDRGVKILSSIAATTDSIKAVAQYTITNLDDGAYFLCIQTHVTLPDKTTICNLADQGSINTPLVVLYPPVLRFVPSSLKVTPLETTRETLKCEYDARPDIPSGPSIRYVPANPNDKLNWNYTTAKKEDSIDVVLTMDDKGKVIECVAENELGISVKKLKIESTGLLPTWILVIIIGGGGLVFFFLVAVICCICFCGGDDDQKDRHSMKKSRLGNLEGSEMDGSEGDMYNSEEGGYNEYTDNQDLDMVPINDFEGGRELKDDFQNENAAYVEYDDDMSDASPIQTKGSSRTYDQVPIDN